jgi:hypothetical protein
MGVNTNDRDQATAASKDKHDWANFNQFRNQSNSYHNGIVRDADGTDTKGRIWRRGKGPEAFAGPGQGAD